MINVFIGHDSVADSVADSANKLRIRDERCIFVSIIVNLTLYSSSPQSHVLCCFRNIFDDYTAIFLPPGSWSTVVTVVLVLVIRMDVSVLLLSDQQQMLPTSFPSRETVRVTVSDEIIK